MKSQCTLKSTLFLLQVTSQLWKCMDITDEDTVTAWQIKKINPEIKSINQSINVSDDISAPPLRVFNTTIVHVSARQVERTSTTLNP